MEPYDTIEEGVNRANALRRTLLWRAEYEGDDDLKQRYLDAAEEARIKAGALFDYWGGMLGRDMQRVIERAEGNVARLTKANALVKRSITDLQDDVQNVEDVVKAIQRLEALVVLVATIAAL